MFPQTRDIPYEEEIPTSSPKLALFIEPGGQ